MGTEENWNIAFPDAAGTAGTCTAQGYILYIGMASSCFFTASLAISFVLQVNFRFREKQMRIAEYFFFGLSTTLPLLSSVFFLTHQMFGPQSWGWCIKDSKDNVSYEW